MEEYMYIYYNNNTMKFTFLEELKVKKNYEIIII